MEEKIQNRRNISISTKVSTQEKAELQRTANANNISIYELIYSLIMHFKDHYQYIGKHTPREEKLINELEAERKKTRKLSLELENAETRIAMERKAKRLLESELVIKQTQIGSLSENLEDVTRLYENLRATHDQLENQLESNSKDMLAKVSIGTGVFAGVSLLITSLIFPKK